MFNLSVDASISEILLDVQALLPEYNIPIVRIIILLSRIKVTEHESKCYVFL
jgi:hypothetical protein